MNLHQLEIFCAVAEERSLTRAAKKLHLSQPAISGQVKAMELFYRLCLFERTNQGVELTAAGELAYRYAKQLLHIHTNMKQALEGMSGTLPCQLAVGASTVAGGYPLPCSIFVFKERHPQSNIRLEVANSAIILEKIRIAALDLAIIEGPADDEDIIVKPCADDEMALVVPYIEPWINMREISLDQLKSLPMIIREEGSGTRTVLAAALAGHGLSLNDLNIVTEMGNLGSIKSSVEAGHGVTILPLITIRKELYTKILKALPIKDLELKLNYKVIYHRNRINSEIAKAFIRLVTDPEERAFC
ncbi:MAG: LysR substrate-binding domain-containing protein [Thermincolia bacterium]